MAGIRVSGNGMSPDYLFAQKLGRAVDVASFPSSLLPRVKLWLRSDYQVRESGGTVAWWRNMVSANKFTPVGANRATLVSDVYLGTRPAVRFNGTSGSPYSCDKLFANPGHIFGGVTLLFIVKATATVYQTIFHDAVSNPAPAIATTYLTLDGGSYKRFTLTDGTGSFSSNNSVFNTNDFVVGICSIMGGTEIGGTYRADWFYKSFTGSTVPAFNTWSTLSYPASTVSNPPRSQAYNATSLLGQTYGGTNPFKSDLIELMILNPAIPYDHADMTSLVNYVIGGL